MGLVLADPVPGAAPLEDAGGMRLQGLRTRLPRLPWKDRILVWLLPQGGGAQSEGCEQAGTHEPRTLHDERSLANSAALSRHVFRATKSRPEERLSFKANRLLLLGGRAGLLRRGGRLGLCLL